MSTKTAPTKITDSDKTKTSNQNVCRHFKVGFCKYGIKCRHQHIIKECEVKSCDKKCPNRHIKACRYGNQCKRKHDCQFKHIKNKFIENNILQEKKELQNLQNEVNALKVNIEEYKKLVDKVISEKEVIMAENEELKKETNLANVKIREQQEEIFKFKN